MTQDGPTNLPDTAIAVVGMALHFPDAPGEAECWRLLSEGHCAIRHLSEDELSAAGVPDAQIKDPNFIPAVSTINGIDRFDAGFFEFSPREAAMTDPQHRLFLEKSWEALEHAGIDAQRYDGLIGVYAGLAMNTYFLHNLFRNPAVQGSLDDFQMVIANDRDFLPTRVSYKLNLRGPSINVQSACSTSLSAVSLACQGLLTGECDMALAGGVSVRVPRPNGYIYREGMIASKDGFCRAFDAQASGTVIGDGVGVVVLRPYHDAVAAGQTIHAVIRGSAMNNDGHAKLSYTAPSVDGQAAVIQDALDVAGLEPGDLSYIETHGTATALGDPVEVQALKQVFGQSEQRCALGSVKSNWGHLNTAAGVAGLIKTVLALKHRTLPPSLHFEQPNPKIDFASSPFYVNTETRPWPTNGPPRRAGVSSFGIGGTNVHVVLEEAPTLPVNETDDQPVQVLPLSARTPAALVQATANLAKHLENEPELALSHVAHTLQAGRTAFQQRVALVVEGRNDALNQLRQVAERDVKLADRSEIVFLFPGQGAATVGMGAWLYAQHPVYRELVDRGLTWLDANGGPDLRQVLTQTDSMDFGEPLADTEQAQPALFIVSCAMAEMLCRAGVEPAALMGHSVGEYAAAWLAGVFSFETGLHLIRDRGRMMARLPQGAMVSLPVSAESLRVRLPADLSLAVDNGPERVVISGPKVALDPFVKTLAAEGLEGTWLHTSHAFHSAMMEPLAEPFRARMQQVGLAAPQRPLMSNLTGTWMTGPEATDPERWYRHIRETVRFHDGAALLCEEPKRLFLEVGPGSTLCRLVRGQSAYQTSQRLQACLAHQGSDDEALAWHRAVAGLWVAGVAFDWLKLLPSQAAPRLIPLPTYPFQRQRYWVDAPDPVSIADQPASQTASSIHPPVEARPDEAEAGENVPEAAPRTNLEQDLAHIWEERLGAARVGIDDNFFELGGDSLMATQILSRMRRMLGLAVTMNEMFDRPTIRDLATWLEQTQRAQSSSVPLKPRQRPANLPLSFAQQRLWFLDQWEEGRSSTYNIPISLRIRGWLDPSAIGTAFDRLAARHETLRTNFPSPGGTPIQAIAAEPIHESVFVDLSGLSPQTRDNTLHQLAGHQATVRFNLAEDAPIRVAVLHLGEQDHALLVTMHHIISDGWSQAILVNEFCHLYADATGGHQGPLQPLPVQYADFTLWQQARFDEEELAAQTAFWRGSLGDAPSMLHLPYDHPRPPLQSFRGGHHHFEIDAARMARLKAFGQARGTTLFMTLLTVYQTLLSIYSGQQDVVVGAPIANRTDADLEPIIGFFVNTLALRTQFQPAESFGALLARVREHTLAAYAHQDLPFDKLVEDLKPVRNISNSPLFQVMFILQNTRGGSRRLPGLQLAPIETTNTTAKHDLALAAMETATGLSCVLEYSLDLFEAETATRLASHFCNLVDRILDDPEQPIKQLSPLSPAERAGLLAAWIGDGPEPDPWGCLHHAVLQTGAERPDATALHFHRTDESQQLLTYGALASRAHAIAERLRSSGVSRGSIVALYLNRGPETVAAMLGTQLAGGAYLPIDPANPWERVLYMFEDAGVDAVVTDASGLAAIEVDWQGPRPPCLAIEDISRIPAAEVQVKVDPEDLAYVIYTSGSSGMPKGVFGTHGPVHSLIRHDIRRLGIEADWRCFHFMSFNFDASTEQMLFALYSGAMMVFSDGAWLPMLLTCHKINYVGYPPNVLATVPKKEFPDLRVTMVGASACDWYLAEFWSTGRRFFNEYGPTETSIAACHSEIQPEDETVTIGRPIPGARLYVLRDGWTPVPIGVNGELFIGGHGVSRGYLGKPGLTAERFLPDPFAEVGGARMYRTGDLVRFLVDGNFKFIGRFDDQIKLRGFRIEIGEIEHALGDCPGVLQSAVALRELRPGDRHLVGYAMVDWPRIEAGEILEIAASRDQWVKQHIDQWSVLYGEYLSPDERVGSGTDHFGGWHDSYLGLPLPEAEMTAWADATANTLAALAPKRVLEIGCGTGLLLFRLAGDCEHYIGTDLSPSSLEYVRTCLPQSGIRPESVQLLQQPAHQPLPGDPEPVDLVVINSVIQYFPDGNYLTDVLTQLWRHVAPGGHLFIGDVRGHTASCLMALDVVWFQAEDGDSVVDLMGRVTHRMDRDIELTVSPDYFLDLLDRLPGLQAVRTLVKRGRYRNELNRYRYDVVLMKQPITRQTGNFNDSQWTDWGGSLNNLLGHLQTESPQRLRVRGIADDRQADIRTRQTILGDAEWNVAKAELTARFENDDRLEPRPLDPEDAAEACERLGYRVWLDAMDWDGHGCFDLWLARDTDPMMIAPAANAVAPDTETTADWTNNPLHAKARRDIARHLRQTLQSRLPDYMVPTAVIPMDRFPLTPNGKIHYDALPPLDPADAGLSGEFIPPKTETEQTLAGIWCEVLDIDEVGLSANFFEMGGHSLLGTQVISRVNETFGLTVPLKELFEVQTLAEFAELIDHMCPDGPVSQAQEEEREEWEV